MPKGESLVFPAQPALTGSQNALPPGRFLLPVCTTRENLQKTLSVLWHGRFLLEDDPENPERPGDVHTLDHMIDVLEALAHINQPENSGCVDCGDEGGCIDYAPNHPIIKYAPNDPFVTPDLIPDDYIIPPWYTNAAIPLPGVLPTDAMVNTAAISALILPSSGFPRFSIEFSGTGELEIQFVQIPAGGLALITSTDEGSIAELVSLDNEVLDGAIATLILNLLGIENAGVVETTVYERKFAQPGNHRVDVTFIPNIAPEAPFILFGGGIRRISLCGLSVNEADMPYFELRQSPNDPCLIEQKTSVNGEWFTAYNLSKCASGCNCGECSGEDEMELRQSPTNPCHLEARDRCGGDWYVVFDMSRCTAGASSQDSIWNEIWQGFYDGTPQSINPNAPSTAGGDEETKIVLCSAVKAWVYKSMINAMQAVATVLQAGTQAPVWSGIFSPFWTIAGGVGNALSIYQFENMLIAFLSQSDMTKMICELTDLLDGDAVSPANLEIACNALTFANTNQDIIKGVLTEASENIANYYLFVAFLGRATVEAALGVTDCPCTDEPAENEGCGDGCTETTDLIQWSNENWIQKGSDTRTLAGTPVGQFDSFDLGGQVEAVYLYSQEVCVKQVQVSTNHNNPASVPQVRLKIGAYEFAPQTPGNGTSCQTNTLVWNIPEGVLGSTIRLLQLSPVTEQNKYAHRVFCMKVTRCSVS